VIFLLILVEIISVLFLPFPADERLRGREGGTIRLTESAINYQLDGREFLLLTHPDAFPLEMVFALVD
jgi:hypothetical protein